MKNYRMLVCGELLDAPDHTPVVSPVTEMIVGNAPRAAVATIDRAVAGGNFRLPSKQWLEFIRNAVD